MPYTNVRFVKLQIEILDDYRFIKLLNDRQKCLYLLLLTLAGRMDNSIPNDLEFIMERIGLKDIDYKDLEKVRSVFPKMLVTKDIISFENYEEIHNYIPGKSKGNPKEIQRTSQIRIDKIRIDNKSFTPPTIEQVEKYFSEELKTGKEQAVRFFQFYGSKDWFVGKNKMKNWHLAAARSLTWGGDQTITTERRKRRQVL